MEHTTTARRPRRLAMIVATALFGVVLAATASFNATNDLATGGKPSPRQVKPGISAGIGHDVDVLATGNKPKLIIR
jgi:hypothetical protein